MSVDAGVAPADAGPGALGGSLVYETKDVSDLLEDGDNFGGSVGLEYNTNGETFDRNVALYGRSGGFEILGYVKSASGDDFEDGNRPERANFNRGFLSENNELKRETLVFAIKNEAPKGLINPYVKIAHSETELVWVNSSYPTSGEYESINGVLANEFVLEDGTVDAGIDYYDDTTKGISPTFNEFPVEKAKNIGVFAQARLSLSERARISFGARYDDHELEGVDGSKHDNSGLSSNITGEYDLTEFVTASAGYSHVFGGVQLTEPYIANAAWDYSAGLKESKADNGFIGMDFNAEGLSPSLAGLTIGAKTFKTDISDIRDEEYGGGPDIYSDVESDGFEINTRYEWQSGFVRLSYIDVDTEINGIEGSTSAYYIGTPLGESLKADFVQSIDSANINFGADVQHYFSMDGHDGTSPVDGAFPSYTVANSFVAYTPQALNNLTLRLSVNNMFDENYADRSTYGHEFGTDTTLNEPGCSVVLGAKFKF
ncbi:TonB-dependent receptor domain-containing protein [Neptuniibacter sp. QD37_6]|uniref:TonB-dependent receptor domain-containing protein n=1 Tax=Neptuniibacter sp. QD37_6 TaxID=3398210 RepID=UPI0039F61161